MFDLERLELDLRLGEDDLNLRPPGEEERDLDLDKLDLEGGLEPALSSCSTVSLVSSSPQSF